MTLRQTSSEERAQLRAAKSRARCEKRRRENPEAARESDRRYHAKNAATRRAYTNAWIKRRRKEDPAYRAMHRMRTRLYIMARSGLAAKVERKTMCGCTRSELRFHIEQQFSRGMTWENYGEWHIDHRRPCASFDLKDPEQVKQCFHFSNLQPLWAEDNLSKKDKWDGQTALAI